MRLFADSSFFIAYYDQTDQYHNQVVKLMKKLSTETLEVFTTDYVYDEVATFLLNSHTLLGYQRAQQFSKDVVDSGKFTFIFITEILFSESRKIFEQYNRDKYWSFTDCTSYVIMKDNGIAQVLTFDTHFTQMGFSLLR